MADLPKDAGARAGETNVDTDRRGFMRGAAAAGLVGAAAIMPGVTHSAEADQAAAGAQDDSQDLARPDGMAPHGQLDSRFPVTYKNSVPKSLNILSQYFVALAERNMEGVASLMHYPFATFEGADTLLIETPDQLMSTPPLSMNLTGKGDSKIKAGAFDVLDSIQLHTYGPVGAGLSLQYSRFEPNGNKLLECHGIYAVTNNDGKWGIEWVSTIFKPANQVMRDEWYNYPIANYALHESHRDHVMARRYNDVVDLRRTVFDPYPHATVGISGLKVKGVKSRLRFSPGDTQEEIDKQTWGQSTFATTSGAGVGTWALSIETPETRMIYSSAEKGHFFSGYYRYTQDGTVISEHRYMGSLLNRKGTWYGNDITRTINHTVYLDHTNDKKA